MSLSKNIGKRIEHKAGIFSLITVCFLMQACAPVIIGGAATGAVVANDKRTTGTFIEDESIELKIRNSLLSDKSLKGIAHINATSF